MSATIRNRLFVVGLVGCHVLAAVATDYFRWNWARLNLSPTVDRLIIASMMVALGADAGLLGVWAALSRLGPAARWFAITTCAVCWSCVYIACESRSLLDWVRYWNCVISPWHYYFLNRWCAVAGLVALVIAGVWGAIALFLHRGTQFRRLNDDQVRETDRFQFQVLDLLVLVLVVSLMLAICGNFREWFSRQISLRWSSPAEAPIYAAESVLLSALFLIVTTLSLVWATLSTGRPWLRLLLSLSGAGLLGAAVAYALTAPNHSHFLIYHALFAAFVGLGQALFIGGVLLRVRRRGYRLIRAPAIGVHCPACQPLAD